MVLLIRLKYFQIPIQLKKTQLKGVVHSQIIVKLTKIINTKLFNNIVAI